MHLQQALAHFYQFLLILIGLPFQVVHLALHLGRHLPGFDSGPFQLASNLGQVGLVLTQGGLERFDDLLALGYLVFAAGQALPQLILVSLVSAFQLLELFARHSQLQFLLQVFELALSLLQLRFLDQELLLKSKQIGHLSLAQSLAQLLIFPLLSFQLTLRLLQRLLRGLVAALDLEQLLFPLAEQGLKVIAVGFSLLESRLKLVLCCLNLVELCFQAVPSLLAFGFERGQTMLQVV